MPLPHTLMGIIGFIVFSAFMVGIIVGEDEGNNIQTTQDDLTKAVQETIEGNAPWSFLTGTAGVLVNTILLMLTSTAMFLNITPKMPQQFVILGILVSMSMIVALIKFIRGVWDKCEHQYF